MPFLRSLTAKLFLSHVLVATLTSMVVTSGMLVVIWIASRSLDADDYRIAALNYVAMWQFDFPESEFPASIGDGLLMPGFTLVASAEDEVLWAYGETPCQVGMLVRDCAPDLAGRPPTARMFEQAGERWGEVIMNIADGNRVLLQRGPSALEPYLYISDVVIYGYRDTLLFELLTHGLLGIPVALLLAAIIARPQIRRLSAISQISRRFTGGMLTARVADRQMDEVGQLGQQFDTMADVLEQNIMALRDLAQRNGDRAQQAEQLAIRAERSRISRDLHDAIAQRLFSLSVSTTTLPDLIAHDRDKGIQQAKVIAELAEQTQLDLRSLLLQLRPTTVLQLGLPDALRTLCAEWQSVNQIEIETSLMLTGKYLPAVVEDAVYRITQEALSNVARHAAASRVELSMVEGQRLLILSISDNGRGFDPSTPGVNGKFGLTSMRERARSIGGELVIESDARGTSVQASLPIQMKEVAHVD